MADYLFSKYKNKYRVLPELCMNTHDFPRDENGNIDPDAETYISCQYGNKISYWGLNSSRRGVLIAYIPSLGRGRNIKKALKKQKIEIFDYDESEEEVMFKFLASDIEPVAELMKARTIGSGTSPFSPKNLPKADVEIPKDKMAVYKEITACLGKSDLLLIRNTNTAFLTDVLQKKLRKATGDKKFDYKQDMRNLKMSRQVKEYIYTKNMWDEYCEYLKKEVDTYFENKK